MLGALNAPLNAKTGALEAPNVLHVLANVEVGIEPKAKVFVALNTGVVLAAPNAGVLVATKAEVLLALNVA